MKTITISLSDIDYINYGFTSQSMSLDELLEIISSELLNLKTNQSILRLDHSPHTMNELTDEIRTVRKKNK